MDVFKNTKYILIVGRESSFLKELQASFAFLLTYFVNRKNKKAEYMLPALFKTIWCCVTPVNVDAAGSSEVLRGSDATTWEALK